jgi:hypothetical protein
MNLENREACFREIISSLHFHEPINMRTLSFSRVDIQQQCVSINEFRARHRYRRHRKNPAPRE